LASILDPRRTKIQCNCGQISQIIYIKESIATENTEESSVSKLAGIYNSMAQEV
jgi:hypothetical protein